MRRRHAFRSLSRQTLRSTQVKELIIVLFTAALLLDPSLASFAEGYLQAERSQAASASGQEETARIDQLIAECRQLISKSSFDDVTRKAEEALALSRKIGDKGRQARALTYVALGTFHAGRTEEAIEPFKQSAALAGEAGDKRFQLLALNSAATLLAESGRTEEALHFYDQSLELCRDQKDRRGEANLLRNIARIHIRTRDYSKAERILLSSIGLARAVNEPPLESAALFELGTVEAARGNLDLALTHKEKALKLESPATPPSARYQHRNSLAMTHLEVGNLEKSAEYSHEALELARSQRIPLAEATVMGNLAELKLKMGKPVESFDLSSHSLAMLRRIGADPTHEATVLYTHAQAQRALGKAEEALASLRRSMALMERARLLFVPTEAAKAALFAGRSDVFLSAIDLLVSLGREDEALSVSESYHARAFLDSLVEARADFRRLMPKELIDKEKSILARISAVQKELWQQGIPQEREQQLQKDLAVAEDDLAEFQREVRRSNPKVAGLKYLEPFTHERIQRDLLDPDTALIEYAVGDERSFAWLVSRDKVSYATLPPKGELVRLITDYRKSLTERTPALAAKQAIASLKLKGRQLYRVLLEPFESRLAQYRKLIIVPDNVLAYLPFETLVGTRGGDGGNESKRDHYLVERFAIAYAPSASALAAVRAVQSPVSSGLVAFGDPVYSDQGRVQGSDWNASRLGYYAERGFDLRRLPYSRTEVTGIGALFPAAQRQVFVGSEANEQRVKGEKLDHYRYVHFAAHGVIDEENPGRSGIILSLEGSEKEDGVLQMTEIMRLKLNADLVTLSACRTGLGKVVSGEGVLGLTRAFLYAGTRSVAVSLWNVNDAATAELMKAFYRGLKGRQSKGEALRQAKLELLNGKQAAWRHPYFWGSFVLVGAER